MISIIVPVYNAEKYIKRCIESIMNQTYKNFEVILIDDGSIDNSGKICDELSYNFPQKIKTIHQENAGVSVTRNTGIQHSKGEFLTFIDSDDYIDKNYLKILLESLNKYNADISCCGHYRVGKNIYYKEDNNINYLILKDRNCIEFYLRKDSLSAWAKLYKKEIFINVLFPLNISYGEDIITIFKVFSKARKIVYINKSLYYYYKNPASVTKQKFTLKTLDSIKIWKDIQIYANNYSDEIQKLLKFKLIKSYFTVLGIIAYYGIDDKLNNKDIIKKQLLPVFNKHYKILLFSNLLPFNRKLAVLLMRISFTSVCKVGTFIRYLKER